MEVRKKKKRKLVFKEKEYYWYMKFTDDWMGAYSTPQLHVISEDKKLIISYQPKQQIENSFLILKGKNINGLKVSTNSWRRVKVPNWQDDEITPGFVSNLLEWCHDENKEIMLVDYLGKLNR